MKSVTIQLLILGLLQQTVACSNVRSIPDHQTASSPASSGSERSSLISPTLLTRYNTPTIPVVTAPVGNPHQQGGEGFVAPRGQRLEMPYDVLCINAAAQAAVEANVEYRDNVAQNNCAAAIRTLGASAVRDMSLIDSAAATREAILDAQVRSSGDALRLANRTVGDLREQMTSNSRFGTFINFLVGLGGLVVGAGLAAAILGLTN
jgi:hypothetical protein